MTEITVGEIGRLLWSYGLPLFLLGVIIYALNQRMYVHHKELDACEARYAKLEAKNNELNDIVFKLVGIGERLTHTVEVAVKK